METSLGKQMEMYDYITDELKRIFQSTPYHIIKPTIEKIVFNNIPMEEIFDLDFKLDPMNMGLRLDPTVLESEKCRVGIGFHTETPVHKFGKGFITSVIYHNIRDYYENK